MANVHTRSCSHPNPNGHAVSLPLLPTTHSVAAPARQAVDSLQRYANQLQAEEAAVYIAAKEASDPSHKFMSTVMASGTMEDKVSALTLLVRESPLHTTKAFEQLLALSRKKSRTVALMALAALKDLLGQGTVLPGQRKLRPFARQPGLLYALQGVASWTEGAALPGAVQKVHLVAWAYEDWLKQRYFELLQAMETWLGDEVEHTRLRVVTDVFELLRDKPEQEDNLMRLLVNKLGDKANKVASRASHLLLQLQIAHPQIKSVVIENVESELLFRPNQSRMPSTTASSRSTKPS